MEGKVELAWLISILLGMLIVIFTMYYRIRILNAESENTKLENQKQLLGVKAAVEAEERLKEKFANDLHDGVVPVISEVSRNLHQYIADLQQNKLTPGQLQNAVWLIDESINTLRSVAHNLVPRTLANFGVIKAMQQVVLSMDGDPDCRTQVIDNTGTNGQLPFAHPDQLNIYRVCLELLNNLRKHDKYSLLQITFQVENSHLIILFVHDGKGIHTSEIKQLELSGKGLGLQSISTRLALLNGVVNYQVDEFNASIQLTIPLKNDTTN